MTKIKIGENEYEGPFDTESSAYDCPHRTVSDEAGNQVSSWDITIALNELSQLRAENAALVKRVEELESEIDEARDYAEYVVGLDIISGSPHRMNWATRTGKAHAWLQRNKPARQGGGE